MRKFLLIISAFCIGLSISPVFAQQKQGHASIPIARNLGKASVVDYTQLRISYAFNAGNVKNIDTYVDYQILDIGKTVSKYYSWFVYNSEKLKSDWNRKHPNAHSVPIWLGPAGTKKDRWCQYEWSDLYIKDGQLIEYACMPDKLTQYNSYYTEQYPSMQWTLGEETAIIIGYKCQKATCRWRGRNFVAWFTSSIPVKKGPWKFAGLPGLILKVYDTKHLYVFEAIGIDKGKHPIIQYKYDGYSKSTREKVQKYQTMFSQNWLKAVGWRKTKVLPNGKIEIGEPVSIFTKYEPIEIE